MTPGVASVGVDTAGSGSWRRRLGSALEEECQEVDAVGEVVPVAVVRVRRVETGWRNGALEEPLEDGDGVGDVGRTVGVGISATELGSLLYEFVDGPNTRPRFVEGKATFVL